jgi:hypothetical protein
MSAASNEVRDTGESFAYKEQLELALMAARSFYTIARSVDFGQILERMERAEAIGPVIDPTLWLQGIGGLKSQRRAVEAAAAFKTAIERQLAEEKRKGPAR